jgi:hypothetical protein
MVALAVVWPLVGSCARQSATGSESGAAGELTISLDRTDAGRPSIEVSGPPVSDRTRLAVYPEHANIADPSYPAVGGELSHAHRRVRFKPRHPLERGSRYQIIVSDSSAGSAGWTSHHWIEVPPPPARQATRVAAVFPSGGELPANQLKLYVEFSGPMATSSPYDYISLVDEATGERQAAVFHQMRDGLWDTEGRRLTAIFDPGRVKRGLANHEAMGLPLEEGKAYRLEISSAWPDADGMPLAESFSKRFVVTPPDRRRPELALWSLIEPAAGTLEPLVIAFDEPLDAALLVRSFELSDPAGRSVSVEARLGPSERSCELWPGEPWSAGDYRVQVDPTLEDLAGNNLNRLFDVDLEVDSSGPPKTWLRLSIPEGGEAEEGEAE